MTDGVFSPKNPLLARYCDGRRISAFVCSTIDRLYGAELRAYLATWLEPGSWGVTVIPTGEHHKTMASVERVCACAKGEGLGRHGFMLAVGGGITCDIVGFAASMYSRGIGYIKVNTTLVGQVDVAVGIKSGVNAFGAKNLLGSFHAAQTSINDIAFLRSLPPREMRCGLGEIIKVAVISDEQMFVVLEKNPVLFQVDATEDADRSASGWRNDGQAALRREVVSKTMRLTLAELCSDLRELETARLLDFGHTFGPVIETASRYRVAHGESVAIDMAISSEIARLLGLISAAECERIVSLIAHLGLPVFDAETCTPAIMRRALEASSERRGRLNLVVPTRVGSATFIREIDDLPSAVLAEALAVLSARCGVDLQPARARPSPNPSGCHGCSSGADDDLRTADSMHVSRQHLVLEREATRLAPGGSEEAAIGRRVFIEGRGAILTDLDGNQYIDFASGILTQSLGHCHPEVVGALSEQARRLWNVHDVATPERAELCDVLARLLPDELDTFSFFTTGAEVVEAALRVVQATAEPGRNRIGALRHGFHGKTLGARMLVHWDIGHQAFAGNSVLGYSPYCYRCPLELERPSCDLLCAKLVRRHIADKPNIAALVFEPVLGAAGVIVPPPGYWEQIADACRANGVLLVADEVLTGGGRTGSFLACQSFGINPDLVTLSKGMASGFPFAILAGRGEVLRHPALATPGATSSTFGGNPLALAAARATLEVVERDGLIARVHTLSALLKEHLDGLAARFAVLGEIRGLGLLYGLEFVSDPSARTPAPEIARRVFATALDLGLRTVLGGNVIRLAPPFIMEESLLADGIAILDRALQAVVGERSSAERRS